MDTAELVPVTILSEGPPVRASAFVVDYYTVSPSGSRARFQRRVGLNQIRGAQSETAVLYYLKGLHPRADILIMRLEFK